MPPLDDRPAALLLLQASGWLADWRLLPYLEKMFQLRINCMFSTFHRHHSSKKSPRWPPRVILWTWCRVSLQDCVMVLATVGSCMAGPDRDPQILLSWSPEGSRLNTQPFRSISLVSHSFKTQEEESNQSSAPSAPCPAPRKWCRNKAANGL